MINQFAQMTLLDKGIFGPFRVFWVDPANGSDQRSGITPDEALATLGEAHNRCTAGMNDVVVLVSDGSITGTARLSTTLTWSKNATHLIGVGAPSMNNRARIAQLSGATAVAAFVVVTASGCIFKNFSVFNDMAIAGQITWDDQAGRNYYEDVFLGGMGDATSAHSTTSRVLRLGGASAAGENIFRRCTIGLDTSLGAGRDVANATIEFSGGSKRNRFEDCFFDISAKATTALHIISSGVNPLETFQMFNRCIFHNPYPHSSASLMAAVATLAANGNGRLIMNDCKRYGATKWGTDATSTAQIYENPANGIGLVAT
jgi:hypothetical protein